MKKITTTIIALAVLLASCGNAAEEVKQESSESNTQTEEQVDDIESDVSNSEMYKEGEVGVEGSDVGDARYDNLSTESATSDCYIVSHFTDMDITYITVDFVSIEENTDSEGYEIVNENKKLRTFVVNEEYLNPYHEENISIDKIFEKASNDPEMLFVITIEDGLVSELYENLAG